MKSFLKKNSYKCITLKKEIMQAQKQYQKITEIKKIR